MEKQIIYEVKRARIICQDCPYHKYVAEDRFFCTNVYDYFSTARNYDTIMEWGCHPNLDCKENY